MKKSITVIISALLILAASLPVSALEISAKAAILISADTGEVIFEKNAHERLPMASTTKIMTALIVLENASLNDTVTVSPEAAGTEGSSIYLFKDEKISVGTLLYALMLESANDAAAALAIHVSGSIEAFADMMNEKAASLGLTDTHFTNPHGLYDDEHYTSAYDLACIASYALKNDTFRKIVSTKRASAPMTDESASRLFINHNKLLKIYDGAIGVKTGFTKKSGRCLVSAAERDRMTFVAVTLSAPDDWADHRAMLDLAFSSYERMELAKAGEISALLPVVSGELDFIKYENKNDIYININKDNKNIETVLELRRFYFGGIKKGDPLGRALFYNGETLVAEAELVAVFDVPKKTYKNPFLSALWDMLKG